MLDILTEARKHFGFFSVSTLLLLVCLAARKLLHSQGAAVEVIWVFGVVLVSSGAAVYVGAQIFTFLVLQRDALLHLSTHSPVRKLAVKGIPLAIGFFIVGLVSLFGAMAMWSVDQRSTGYMIYACGAKALSSLALVSSAWILGIVAARLRGFYPRLLIFGGGLAALTGLQIALVWRAANLSGTEWLVGGSSTFAGYPIYCGPLGLALRTSFTLSSHGAFVISAALNAVWPFVCVISVLLLGRSRRGVLVPST